MVFNTFIMKKKKKKKEKILKNFEKEKKKKRGCIISFQCFVQVAKIPVKGLRKNQQRGNVF